MILADTSVWIDHLRKGDPMLATLLNSGQIVMHPYVLGELALGHIRQRAAVLNALQSMPRAKIAREDEVMFVIERWSFAGMGIGYVDAHLLAAIPLSPGSLLWTRDKRLRTVAESLAFHANLK